MKSSRWRESYSAGWRWGRSKCCRNCSKLRLCGSPDLPHEPGPERLTLTNWAWWCIAAPCPRRCPGRRWSPCSSSPAGSGTASSSQSRRNWWWMPVLRTSPWPTRACSSRRSAWTRLFWYLNEGSITFDVVIDGRLGVLVFEKLEGVGIGCSHELVAILNAVLLVVVDDELPVCDVLRHLLCRFVYNLNNEVLP